MKHNPKMKVLLMGGYFDLGTLYFGATYEMKHLPSRARSRSNISYKFFPDRAHGFYVNEDALHGLHDTVAAFHSLERKAGSNWQLQTSVFGIPDILFGDDAFAVVTA